MNTATAKESLVFEASDEIRRDEQLLGRVEVANRYLRELLNRHKLEPADRKVLWLWPDPGLPVIQVGLVEHDELGERFSKKTITLQRMEDRVARESIVSSLLQDALRQRWYQQREVIEQEIRKMEAVEREGDAYHVGSINAIASGDVIHG